MPASAAKAGLGSKFGLKATVAATSFTDIAEVFDIKPPNEQVEEIEVTHYQSPDGFKEFILGLTDPGDCSFEMNLVPGSASEVLILAAKAAREARGAQITFPNGWTWGFTVLVKGYEPAMPLNGKMTATVTCKVTGSVVRAAPAGGGQ